MTNSSSRRTTRGASGNTETSAVPTIEADHSDLSDVTSFVSAVPINAMPAQPQAAPYIPELDEPAEAQSTSGRRYAQPYVSPLMAILRRLRRQAPDDIPQAEMDAHMAFLQDTTGELRVNSIFLGEAVSFMASELYQRYSQTALTVAIYLGKNGGLGVSNVKREIARATGVVIGESDPLNGFPRHQGLRYTAQQLIDAVNYLNEAYGEHGSINPGAITNANELLRQKNEAAGRTNRY